MSAVRSPIPIFLLSPFFPSPVLTFPLKGYSSRARRKSFLFFSAGLNAKECYQRMSPPFLFFQTRLILIGHEWIISLGMGIRTELFFSSSSPPLHRGTQNIVEGTVASGPFFPSFFSPFMVAAGEPGVIVSGGFMRRFPLPLFFFFLREMPGDGGQRQRGGDEGQSLFSPPLPPLPPFRDMPASPNKNRSMHPAIIVERRPPSSLSPPRWRG